MMNRSYASVKNPIPAVNIARRWKTLRGASFSASVSVPEPLAPSDDMQAPFHSCAPDGIALPLWDC